MPIYWHDDTGSGSSNNDDGGSRPRSPRGRWVTATVLLVIVVVVSARLTLVALVDAPVALGAATLHPRPTSSPTVEVLVDVGESVVRRPSDEIAPLPTSQIRTFRLAVEQGLYDAHMALWDTLDKDHDDLIVLPHVANITPEDLLTQRLADGIVFWTIESLPYGMPLAEIPYALIAHPQLGREGFSLSQMTAIVEGLDQTYTFVVPSDDRLVRRFLDLDVLGYWVARVGSWDDVVDYVASHEGAMGIVPWDLADHRVRPVLVDGQRADPSRTSEYPFCRRMWLLESSAMLMPAEALEELRRELAYDAGPSLVLVAVGDVMLGSDCSERIAEEGPRYPFEGEGIWSLISSADVALGNLACVLSERGQPLDGSTSYRADPSSVEGLVYAGLDVVSLGNEHAMAFGKEALGDTLASLQDAGIATVGAGMDREDAYEPYILEHGGLRVAIIGVNMVGAEALAAGPGKAGVAWLDDTWTARAVRKAREMADVVIVSCRWEDAHAVEVSSEQIRAAEGLIEAGADLIIGHHSHVVQAISRHEDGVVAYSLGDLVSTTWSDSGVTLGLALRCRLTDRGVKAIEPIPLSVTDCQPYVLEGEAAADALAHIDELVVIGGDAQEGASSDPG